MKSSLFYVVNFDSTTGIALEVAEKIKEKYPGSDIIAYYKHSPYPRNNFVKGITNIEAKGPFDFRAIKKVVNLIKEKKPQVIHTHHTWSALIFFMISKIYHPTAKLIKTEHNDHRYFRWYQTVMNFFILGMADIVICNSGSTRDSFSSIEKRLTKGKTRICYNGVNLEAIKRSELTKKGIQNLLPVSARDTVIGGVGRFVKQKDFKVLISAFNLIKQKSERSLKLVLIGDGPEVEKLKELVRKYEIQKSVIFTGALERKQVFGCLRMMDIFVVSSKWEGFCNALVEAMAAGKAIVCSDINTLREVAGNAACFAEIGRPESFCSKIMDLLENQDFYNTMKDKALQRAEKFSIEACAENYINFYK